MPIEMTALQRTLCSLVRSDQALGIFVSMLSVCVVRQSRYRAAPRVTKPSRAQNYYCRPQRKGTDTAISWVKYTVCWPFLAKMAPNINLTARFHMSDFTKLS